ncbi:ribonuclease R [Thermodesulfobacteriota bacterium]
MTNRRTEARSRKGGRVKRPSGRSGGVRRPTPARKTVSGRFQAHAGGFGFVIPDKAGQEDVFLPPPEVRGLMDGDRVVVEVRPRDRVEREAPRKGRRRREPPKDAARRKGFTGHVVKVMEKVSREVVGLYVKDPAGDFIIPDGRRIPFEIQIPGKQRRGAVSGQMVAAEVTSPPERTRRAEGRIVEILGDAADPGVDARIMVRKHGLPEAFPAEVLAETGNLHGRIRPGDMKGRVDLRGIPLVTIDGETAKDFDDAVAVERTPDGGTRLLVSIADVSHFVRPGSALDEEALSRGTSVYFPGQVVPMLPPMLSDDLCSLRPSVNRLTLTVEMVFDAKGRRLRFDVFPSVIRSAARLTYTQVRDVLASRRLPKNPRLRGLTPSLRLMRELAMNLRERRRRRGSLDFDMPEPEIILDLRGRVENILRAERNEAHRIIEEFMITANEAIAEFLQGKGVRSLHRVHEQPDPEKMRDLVQFLDHFGIPLKRKGNNWMPGDISRALRRIEGRREETLVQHMVLRAMKLAKYFPEPLGHFGLAMEMYTHFTSPIRRYPDLVIHRLVKAAIEEKRPPLRKKKHLAEIAARSSERERVAVDAEREIIAVKKARFMKERVGEEFPGIITGITRIGIWVELVPFFVDGLIPLSYLTDDYYMVDEPGSRLVGKQTKRMFRVGDEVIVQVDRVDILRRETTFAFIKKSVRVVDLNDR